jgi:hypothetical protein
MHVVSTTVSSSEDIQCSMDLRMLCDIDVYWMRHDATHVVLRHSTHVFNVHSSIYVARDVVCSSLSLCSLLAHPCFHATLGCYVAETPHVMVNDFCYTYVM